MPKPEFFSVLLLPILTLELLRPEPRVSRIPRRQFFCWLTAFSHLSQNYEVPSLVAPIPFALCFHGQIFRHWHGHVWRCGWIALSATSTFVSFPMTSLWSPKIPALDPPQDSLHFPTRPDSPAQNSVTDTHHCQTSNNYRRDPNWHIIQNNKTKPDSCSCSRYLTYLFCSHTYFTQ